MSNVKKQKKEPVSEEKNSLNATVWQGLGLSAFVALLSYVLSSFFPAVGSPIFAILLGVILRNTAGMNTVFIPGVSFATRQILQWAIVFLGFGLSFQEIVNVGAGSVWLIVLIITVSFVVSLFIGKLLRVERNVILLVGAGTGICGGTAIAAVSPIIKASENETSLSISIIFLYNIVAIFAFPLLGQALSMGSNEFGLWSGTAINDTSSVIAAAYSFSSEAGDYATVVKLTRATFIIPICVIFTAMQIIKNVREEQKLNYRRLIPWFIVFFLGASLLSTFGVIPGGIIYITGSVSNFLITVALAGVGLSSDIGHLSRVGNKPLFLGLVVWCSVVVVSLLSLSFIL